MSLADVEQRRDGALCIHDAAGAERIADALVDAVFERDVDVGLKGLQPTLADRADDVVGVGNGLAAVGGRRHCRRQIVGGDVAPAQLRDHVQVVLGNVHQGEGGVRQFRHGQNVVHQPAREADRTGADHGDFDRHEW